MVKINNKTNRIRMNMKQKKTKKLLMMNPQDDTNENDKRHLFFAIMRCNNDKNNRPEKPPSLKKSNNGNISDTQIHQLIKEIKIQSILREAIIFAIQCQSNRTKQ